MGPPYQIKRPVIVENEMVSDFMFIHFDCEGKCVNSGADDFILVANNLRMQNANRLLLHQVVEDFGCLKNDAPE